MAGDISNSVTLNRYAYANGNPVSNIDPFGLSAERENIFSTTSDLVEISSDILDIINGIRELIYINRYQKILDATKPKRIPQGSWNIRTEKALSNLDDALGNTSKFAKKLSSFLKVLEIAGYVVDGVVIAYDVYTGVQENIENGTPLQRTISDAIVDVAIGVVITYGEAAVGGAVAAAIPVPGLDAIAGVAAGYGTGKFLNFVFYEEDLFFGKSGEEWIKDAAGCVADRIVDLGNLISDTVSDAGEAESSKIPPSPVSYGGGGSRNFSFQYNCLF